MKPSEIITDDLLSAERGIIKDYMGSGTRPVVRDYFGNKADAKKSDRTLVKSQDKHKHLRPKKAGVLVHEESLDNTLNVTAFEDSLDFDNYLRNSPENKQPSPPQQDTDRDSAQQQTKINRTATKIMKLLGSDTPVYFQYPGSGKQIPVRGLAPDLLTRQRLGHKNRYSEESDSYIGPITFKVSPSDMNDDQTDYITIIPDSGYDVIQVADKHIIRQVYDKDFDITKNINRFHDPSARQRRERDRREQPVKKPGAVADKKHAHRPAHNSASTEEPETVSESNINQIDFSSSLGNLTMSDKQLISKSSVDGTIGSKKVFLFDSGENKIYFFTNGSEIEALIYLLGDRLQAMKRFSKNHGLVYNLFQYVINIKKQKIRLSPTDKLTREGIDWVIEQIQRPTGFKITDQRGHAIDADSLYDEWETARETGKHGPTSVIIGESSNGAQIRENEERLIPLDIFGATLKQMNDRTLGRLIVPDLFEVSMKQAAHKPEGARFGGYWKGTDKNPPRPGQGVGASESVEPTEHNELDEVAPPGMEATVKKLKQQYPGNPGRAFATAWSIYNKKRGKK
jgi:hypothetical protein